jgi:hypothetical protein
LLIGILERCAMEISADDFSSKSGPKMDHGFDEEIKGA